MLACCVRNVIANTDQTDERQGGLPRIEPNNRGRDENRAELITGYGPQSG